MMLTPILTLRNEIQISLWELEIVGQLSDGNWENSRPHDHWKIWSDAHVVVGENVGRNFFAVRDRYNLTDRDLLDVVGKRMLAYTRWTKVLGLENAKILDKGLELDGSWRGIPTHSGSYWDKVREDLTSSKIDLSEARKIAEDDGIFSMRDMKRELNDMKKIMRTWTDRV